MSAPVEIARKVLEAAAKAEPRPWTADAWGADHARCAMRGVGKPNPKGRTHPGQVIADFHERGDDRTDVANIEYAVLAANEATALARAVIELSAENERLHGLIEAAHALSECACICPRHIGVRRILRGADADALAALSPTEGDGRKEGSDGR